MEVTTLNKFAEMHNMNPLSIKILMNMDGEYYKNWTTKENGELKLSSKAILKLEQTLDQMSNISIPVMIIKSVVPNHESIEHILSGKSADIEVIATPNSKNEMEYFITGDHLNKIVEMACNPVVEEKAITNDKESDSIPENSAADPVEESEQSSTSPSEMSDEQLTQATENKIKRTRRKKTPFAVSRSFFEESGKADISDVKLIRQFLLSLPNCKMEDIALMDDVEILTMCEGRYYCIESNDHLIIFPRESILKLADEINVIPK